MGYFRQSLKSNFCLALLASISIVGQATPVAAAETLLPISHFSYQGGRSDAGEAGHWSTLSLTVDPPNKIVGMSVVLTVPPKLTHAGSTFFWPGLQPATDTPGFRPVGDGVLQPVLTWGLQCAPTAQPPPYSSWWISGQYADSHCFSGPSMNVNVGDSILEDFKLTSTGWTLTMTDLNTLQHVAFGINLLNQPQNFAIFTTEAYGNRPGTNVTFQSIAIAFERPVPKCNLDPSGLNYHGSSIGFMQIAAGGRLCEYRNVTLYPPPPASQGIINGIDHLIHH